MKKPKPRCKNCGDEYHNTKNAVGERESKGWCVPCFAQWKKYRHVNNRGEEYWVNANQGVGRTPYGGRPTYTERGE